MSDALSAWLERRWYGDMPPGLGLRLLAGVYRVGKALREARIVPTRLPAPVLVIGNFAAGGTGKTPLAIAVARWLAATGRAPAILSRGHGRASTAPVEVRAGTSVADCGDEPRLLFERTGVPVFVDADRVAAGRAALAAGARTLLCDDGLQHRALARDLEIEVVDGQRGYGNGLLLPAGPLREAPRACDLRVVNGLPPPGIRLPGVGRLGEWTMQLQPSGVQALDGGASPRRLEDFSGRPVHAVAGIGNPGRFFDMLRAHGLDVVPHGFADHHAFVPADFEPLGRPLLMTAKDAVKCRGLGLDDAWVVEVDAVLDPSFFDALARALDAIDAAGR